MPLPSSRLADISISALIMGALVALVGFTSSFAIVLQGLRAAGADDDQAASGLMAVSIAMGLSGVWLSLTRRQPISVAWSTPGAALLIGSADSLDGFDSAIGCFIVSGVLLVLAGWFKPLSRVTASIPVSLANAMLAGILLTLCVAPVKALAYDAWLAMPLLLTWWLVGRRFRLMAVPAALLVLVLLVVWRLGLPFGFGADLLAAFRPEVVWVLPRFDPQALVGIALPLFVVTMASQNVPGLAVLKSNGYPVEGGPLITQTGFFSILAAPFGSHAVNLAAITAALCAGEDAHADPARRYWAATVAGVLYVVFGLCAGAVVLLMTQVPAILIEAIAGLALLGAFSSALVAAFHDPADREAAAVAFLFAGSGLALMGIGGAFWGLVAGALVRTAGQAWRVAG